MAGRRRAALLGCGLLLAAVFAPPAAAAPGDVITVTDPALADTAALATDFDRGLYWTAPAHPETGTVYALDAAGQVVGQVGFDGFPATVEGAAIFNGLLYLGDVGDPHASRPNVRVFRLESSEPGSHAPYSEWTLTYPDGPQDAKAFMVSPRGNLWIVTFGDPGKLYYAQAPASGYGQLYLELVAQAPAYVTDATFLDGNTVALRTYNGIYTMDMTSYALTAAAELPPQPVGESVSQSLDGAGLLVGSSGDARLLGVPVPTAWVELPAQPTPPGTLPEPSETPMPPEPATPDATAAPEPSGNGSAFDNSKSRIAIGIAALISVTAAALAYFRPGKVGRR